MSDLNSCNFTGRLTKDARVKQVGSKGTSVAEFAIAINTGYGQYEKTTFIECQLWGVRADSLAQYLIKGTRVAVEGALEANNWEDQQGVMRTTYRLTLKDIVLLGSPRGQQQSQRPNYDQPPIDEDEVVF